MVAARLGQPVPEVSPGTACRDANTGTLSGTIGATTTAPAHDNNVGIGCLRMSRGIRAIRAGTAVPGRRGTTAGAAVACRTARSGPRQ